MPTDNAIRVGYIPYLNCVPFFHHLKECGFSGSIIAGVPSALNSMLRSGEIDVSPSSSFEYAVNSSDYLLLPDHSISSQGPIKSVLLFSPCSLSELQGRKIAITGESATSINLLRILLLEFTGLTTVDDYVPDVTVESLIANRQPALLIGDRAMAQAKHLPADMKCFDLGTLWFEQTGLPFVFALWILRRDSADRMAQSIKALQEQLMSSKSLAFNDLTLLATKSATAEITASSLVNYWNTIDYSLNDNHLEGLKLFFNLCQKHGLLKTVPKIEFFNAYKVDRIS